jgi:hypothetical protein
MNTATVTLQNYAYNSDGQPIQIGTTDFSGLADVDFESAIVIEIDECALVEDNFEGNIMDLGQVCSDDIPKRLNVTGTVGPFADPICEIEFTNIANVTTIATQTSTLGIGTVNVTAGNPPDCESGIGFPIPTLSQWGMISLSMFIMILGIVGLKQTKVIFG